MFKSETKPRPETKQRLVAALKLHVARHPRDGQSVNRLARLVK